MRIDVAFSASGRVVHYADFRDTEEVRAFEWKIATEKALIAKNIISRQQGAAFMFQDKPLRGNTIIKAKTMNRPSKDPFKYYFDMNQPSIKRFCRRY